MLESYVSVGAPPPDWDVWRPMIAALTEAPPVDSPQEQVAARSLNRKSPPKPGSAADGVALHAAGVGGGFEDPARRRFLAGAAGEAAFGPRLADAQAVAAPHQFVLGGFREAAFEGEEAGLRRARVERARHVLGVEGGAVDRLLQVHAVVDVVQEHQQG